MLTKGDTKMVKLKNIYGNMDNGYFRKEPLIVVNETEGGKTIIGNNKIVVIGGDKPLVTCDWESNTVFENLEIISVKELIELHSNFTFLNRLKFLLTGNLTHLTKGKERGKYEWSSYFNIL